MSLVSHAKRVLGIGTRVRPVLLSDVEPSAAPHAMSEEVRAATISLVQDVMSAERKSWELREALARNAVIRVAAGSGQ